MKRTYKDKRQVAVEKQQMLSPLRKRMVAHITATGDGPSKTARALNCNRSSVQVALRDSVVQQELQEQVGHRLHRASAIAGNTLINLARDARSEYVQLQASDSILDRTGFKPPERSLHSVQGDVRISIDLG
jgi:hypothetical protein